MDNSRENNGSEYFNKPYQLGVDFDPSIITHFSRWSSPLARLASEDDHLNCLLKLTTQINFYNICKLYGDIAFPIQTSAQIDIQRLISFISDLLDTKRSPSTHQITLIIYNPDNQSSQVATLIVSEDDQIYTFFNCGGEELDSESTSTASKTKLEMKSSTDSMPTLHTPSN